MATIKLHDEDHFAVKKAGKYTEIRYIVVISLFCI